MRQRAHTQKIIFKILFALMFAQKIHTLYVDGMATISKWDAMAENQRKDKTKNETNASYAQQKRLANVFEL